MAKKNKKSKKKQTEQFEAQANNVQDAMEDIAIDAQIFLQEDEALEGFLPEVAEAEEEEALFASSDVDAAGLESDLDEEVSDESTAAAVDLEGSELAGFESAEIDEVEFVEDEQVESIVESILFASDRPVSYASIREVFKGTNVKKDKIKRVLENLAVEYAGGRRGVSLEEVTGGYQLRTKVDNMNFLKRTVKARPFKLSGPALETLAIVAYKQPVVKSEIDQIRGVESGHLLRALMEKGLCNFEGKAETLPGKPMQYGTTRRFLEIFGLRNLKELPTLSQIDELLPEGIGDEEEVKPTLSMVTDTMSEEVKAVSYSEGEEELGKIENELSEISTSSDFFEQEKIRQKQKRDAEKAQDIRDALAVGEPVPKRDVNWLARYEEALNAPPAPAHPQVEASEEIQPPAGAEVAQSFEDEGESLFSEDSSEEGDELEFIEEADEDGSDSVKISLSDEDVSDDDESEESNESESHA